MLQGPGARPRFVPKLTLFVITDTCLVLAGSGYLRVRRELASFEEDRVRDDWSRLRFERARNSCVHHAAPAAGNPFSRRALLCGGSRAMAHAHRTANRHAIAARPLLTLAI
jgi:hypothetical protein